MSKLATPTKASVKSSKAVKPTQSRAVAQVTLSVNADGTVTYEIVQARPDIAKAFANRMTGETKAKGIARAIQLAAEVGRPAGVSQSEFDGE